MKRRGLSLILMLALCLNLCPVWVLAAEVDPSGGLCPHHPEHTDECGYAPPTPEQECTHTHDESCCTTTTDCIHVHTAECYPDGSDPETDEPSACTHECTEESGCVTRTLACVHEHDETCGYVPGNPGAPCTFVCQICPIDALIEALPRSVSAYNSEQVQAQLMEIYDLYDALSVDEQQQVDLSPCAALQDQINEMGVAALSDSSMPTYGFDSDITSSTPYKIDLSGSTINTNGYTLSGTGSSAILVTGTGELTLNGKVVGKAIGVIVESGGSLTITDESTSVTGDRMNALSIAAGARVTLAAGKYSGGSAAILADDYVALLAPGCAYFDENGDPISLSDVASAKTVIVRPCTEHSDKTYEHNFGTTTHTWTCPYCGTTETEMCTFEFEDDGVGTCIYCDNSIRIEVDEKDLSHLVYDGTVKPEDVDITVTITDGSDVVLTKGTDYEVEYESRTDAGEITVTVTGITFNGTFIKTYTVAQDQPGISWSNTTWAVDYDSRGIPVDSTKLPSINITLTTSNNEDLHQYLQYSYREVGDDDAEFIDGLPTNAGQYEVKAYLPESQNYKAAETDPCLTLTINKISALITAPEPTLPTYDKTSHELVTAGEVQNGVVIEYAQSASGPYSTDIPTGINAGDYTVWYRIADTDNYIGCDPTEVEGVKIKRKEITPYVTLSAYTYLYTGGDLQPTVTVIDTEDGTELLGTEYEVAYANNRNVTTASNPATVTVSDKAGGNYEILPVTVKFEITAQTQNSLSIDNKPNTVTYGDKFTLSTVGGSDDGKVTWEIIDVDGVKVATIDPDSGQVTVIGHGPAIVKVTRAVASGNYNDATDTWTFTAEKKPVVATVTAEDKEYDGTTVATIHAVVESGVLAGDEITIADTDLIGTFSDENVGVDKTVTVDTTNAVISGTNYEHYDISYSSLTVKATISKKFVGITTAPSPATLIYNGTAQTLLTSGASTNESGVNVEYALSEDGPYSTALPKATDAGDYTVWYRVQETSDYIGKAPASVTVTIAKKSVTAAVTVDADPVTYDGTAQTPAVTVKDNGDTIPDSNYTVTYSNNINAGTATVTVTAKDDGNYTFDAPVTTTFAIDPKHIIPKIELSETSYKYDGTTKNPKITVKDGQTVLDEDQYKVNWDNDLTSAGIHTVTVSEVSGTNYTFDDATAQVEIVTADQDALKITGKPDHVYYGDTITTLDTDGGTGNGAVKWTLSGGTSSSINSTTGELTIKDVGTLTVTAERVVPNYGTVSDDWTFTVEPKPVVAEVTIAAKDYDGTTTIASGDITAVVKSSDLVNSGDGITISGLKGAYEDANAGTNKTVTLDDTDAEVNGDTDKYAVSFPATAKADIDPRAVDVTVTLSDHDLKPDDDGDYYYEYDGNEKKPTVTVLGEDAGNYKATLASSDYTVEYSDNKNVGTATVTVTNAAGGNYTFDTLTVTFEIKEAGAQLTGTPQAKDLTYTGQPQELVTVGTATGGHIEYSLDGGDYDTAIPKATAAGTYTVSYKVVGDGNHGDTAPGQVSVTIKPKALGAEAIALDTTSYTYSGTGYTPAVTVKDGTVTVANTWYTVSYHDNINAGWATVVVSAVGGGNYAVNGSVQFEIEKANAVLTTNPTGKTNLQYNGALQELVTAGVSSDGTVLYSVNGGNYTSAIPTASAVATYSISYKVQGDDNHNDFVGASPLTVAIAKNTVTTPTISLSSDQFPYNGSQQKPAITVYDDSGLLIPEHEYVVTITGTKGNNMVDVDTYTVEITTPPTSNYDIQGNNTRPFKIVPANQETISISGTKAQVYYGDVIQLSATGGTGTESVTWKVEAKDGSSIDSTIGATGLLTVKDVGGPLVVTATRPGGGNYSDVSATWEFSAAKKPVTAVVTADDRNYIAGDTSADLTATVPDSELVSGDSITITGLTGKFDDENAGTNKKVTINKDGVSFGGNNSANYDVTIPATTTASILKAAATVDTEPGVPTLTYNAAQSQELVTAGSVTGGTMVYSLDGTNFTAAIPKAKDADTYTVYFKAEGNSNHTDSAVGTKTVTIGKQSVTPQIELSPPSAPYDGKVHQPAVTLRDDANNEIPASEYKVTYVSDNSENWTDKGTYTVKVDNIAGGNYVITTATEDFTISATEQAPLEIVDRPGLVYYGDTFTLRATGGSGSGTVTWTSSDDDIASVESNGLVTIKGTGSVTITAEKTGGTNYEDATATYSFYALKKPITAIVTADDKVFDNKVDADIHVTWKDGDLVGADSINTTALKGEFRDVNVGTNKTVNISGGPITETNYDITIPATTTASIFKADAKAPDVTANNRTYDTNTQDLVTGGNTGTTLYSDSRDGVYSTTVPTGTNAGTYIVWYKETGDDNHNDSAPQAVTVDISRKTLSSPVSITLSGNDLKPDAITGAYYYEYDGNEKKPTVTIVDGAATVPASEYTVSYSNNKNVGTATVTITSNEGGNYTFAEQTVQFTITGAGAQLTGTPQAKDLTYTGADQELVTVGTATGGHIEYSLDGGDYDTDIPKADAAGTYTVSYKVVGDVNHPGDTAEGSVSVTIKPKEIVSPVVTVTGTYTYDGTAQNPAVTVEDGSTTIPAGEYTVSYRDNIDAGTATVIITNANGGNYIVNGTGSFTIEKAAIATTDVTKPTGLNLPYNGTAQALVKAGGASGGTMVYSLSATGDYSPSIPTETAVGNFTVYYKVQGDDNHKDTTPNSVSASIIQNTVNKPTIQVVPESVTYNSKKQVPTVTVLDDKGLLIDGSEYTVTYQDEDGNTVTDPTGAGEYTLTITETSSGNYEFDTSSNQNTATFTILEADQTPLTINGTRDRVYYGDTIQLSTSGGNGTVAWTVDEGTIATISTTGLLKITGVGSVTVTATSTAAGYNAQKATWTFYAEKKPVTAVVTAKTRDYDGTTDAEVTATLQSSDLVNGDVIKIELSGSFDDANAGTNKKVTVDASDPDFDGSTGDPENYNITYPATTTASILKADIDTADITAPEVVTGLEYTSKPLALVTAGSSTEGTMEYSTDNVTYSVSLPTGTDAGDYDVWYRVKGDSNHNDTAAIQLSGQVTIDQQTVDDPIIEFTPNSVSYDGAVHKPEVKVKDKYGREIPDTEYTVTYDPDTDWKTAKKHAVTVTANEGGNYTFDDATKDFEILMMGQNPLTILNQPGRVQYGDTFTLFMSGGSGTGAMTWESSDSTVASIDAQSGFVTVHKSGSATIYARKAADSNYSAQTATWTFSAEKKPVTAIVTAKNKEYDTKDDADLVVTWPAGALVNGDTIDLATHLKGAFDDANVGTNKTVTISSTSTLPDDGKYDVTWNTTTTASITPKAASVTGVTPQSSLAYTGQALALVSAGSATGGSVVYSLDGGASYLLDVPKATNAGTYTVWYKALADENYKDSTPASVSVTIEPKTVSNPTITLTPDTFEYDGTPKRPDVEVKDGSTVIPASEYSVSYSGNTAVGTGTVTITDVDGGNYQIATKSENFTIKGGAATLTGAPQAKSLTYNGNAQELVTDGTAVNGQVVYSLTDGDDYTPTIPTGINAGTYTVYYKVQGANGAVDTAARVVYVTIQKKTLDYLEIVVEANDTVPYTGTAYQPNVTVWDGNKQIDAAEYTVTYKNNTNPGTASIIVTSKSSSNYSFRVTETFEIVKEAAEFSVKPTGQTLTYNGKAQELVTPGTSADGIVYYTMDGATYSYTIPTATDVGKYIILAKVVGNKTHEDSDPIQIMAEITVNEINAADLTVELPDGDHFDYTGKAITPTVIVRDDNGNIIPASEYTVTYENNINAGTNTAKIHITSTGGNYSFNKTETFTIVGPDQPALVITGKPDTVYYGDTFLLKAEGGSGTGTVTWSVTDGSDVADISQNGTVTVKKSGSVTIEASDGTSKGTLTFYISPKPVKADVIAHDKTYDNSTNATLTVVFSGLVPSESISDTGYEVTGTFTNENVGNNIPVIISLTVKDSSISEKYAIDYNHTTTASITQATASVTGVTAAAAQAYNGSPQALVDSSGATVTGGYLAYSLNGTDYNPSIPTGTDADTYIVWYKVIASDGNYKDSAPVPLGSVTITQNTDPVKVQCTPSEIAYDGTEKTPTVVVLDSANRPIPESEYSVSIDKTAIAAGEYTVTVADKAGGNYEFTSPATGTFKIVAASQPLLTVTGAPTDVLHYGDKFILRAEGGSGSGAIQWSIASAGSTVATIDADSGLVTVTGIGSFTVEAYREGDDNYGDSSKVSLPFYADPKPVTPVVLAEDKVYDGTTNAKLTASLRSSDLVGNDNIGLAVTGQFMTPDVGTGKQVVIEPKTPSTLYPNYLINWPASTTASITRAQAVLNPKPAAASPTYDASAQPLLTGGTTEDSIGTVEYSREQYGEYSTDIPTGTNAGTYVVWYRVEDNVNYMGIDATSITVVIKKATPTFTAPKANAGTVGQTLKEIGFSDGGSESVPGKFTWVNGSIKPDEGTSQQDVIFTPNDTANYETVAFSIPVTVNSASGSGSSSGSSDSSSSSSGSSGGSGTNSASTASTVSTATQTTVRNGTASTVLSAAEGSKLVREAAANQSQSIVIQPEISADVTKAEVSIPAATVSEITAKTSAALTVSAPMADVTISPAALQALSDTGSSVSVAAEQVEQAVVLTLTADGETVENLPGGLTLTVPAEDAAPGTVAVLVHDDGTRETIRKSVVEDGQLSIPLSGSATVEIVDNSKSFSDVPDTSWAADAVAFASAHELFNGTSETTFSPDEAMSRGMLATVLYNLEGSPEQALACDFGDVSDEAWYADSVAWAAENGIASGYGDGQFGPNDSITREQFVVMLWKYAGSPASSTQTLDFTDADQASGYALEALCWATENGILNGYGDGQLLPGGTATRAQAAQMLKNFMENT